MSNRSLLLPAVCAAVLLLSSCQKAINYFEQHPEAYVPPCQITNYRVFRGGGIEANFIVTYNELGNPISFLDSDRTIPFGSDQYFRYDKLNRLSDCIVTLAPSTASVVWHKYFYARPDYIIDSAIDYSGNDVHGPAPIAKNNDEASILAYTLDDLGRIVKVWSIPNDPPYTPTLQSTLVYDANGNLPLPSGLSYDNKVNVYRTNSVWQFLNKDYSRNNLVMPNGSFPLQYNNFGLPLNSQTLFNIFPFGEPNLGSEAFIDYACSIPKGLGAY